MRRYAATLPARHGKRDTLGVSGTRSCIIQGVMPERLRVDFLNQIEIKRRALFIDSENSVFELREQVTGVAGNGGRPSTR